MINYPQTLCSRNPKPGATCTATDCRAQRDGKAESEPGKNMSDTSMPATGFRLLVSGRNTPMYEIRWFLDLESRMLLRSPTFKKTLICATLRKASSVEEQGWDDANGTSHHSACLGPQVTV